MTQFELHQGDCLEVMKTLPDNSVDSIVTDPPYGISFMGKKWDYDVPGVDVWAEALRLLKPGGHIFVACGTRTQHRMVVNIEDAGFEIRDTVAWIYGSGFPKSLDVSKQIDKHGGKSVTWFGKWLREWRAKNNVAQKEIAKLFPSATGGFTGCVANWELGLNMPTAEQFSKIVAEFNLPFASIEEAEREIIGEKQSGLSGGTGNTVGRFADSRNKNGKVDVTAPASDEAKQWQGWGTALKPAMELWTLARKPLIGTVAQNVLKWGTGAINVDGCRIETDEIISNHGHSAESGKSKSAFGDFAGIAPHQSNGQKLGRFPANVIHDGSDEVLAGFPHTSSGKVTSDKDAYGDSSMFLNGVSNQNNQHGDAGSAARFFYCAKASKSDRNGGLDGFPVDRPDSRTAIGMGTFEEKGVQPQQNHHPTVKPTALMQYLCRLITPPGGTVLDPYTGSGSTGKAAMFEDFRFIGIERELEYVEIATARIEAARTREPLFLEADSQKTQGGLF